MIRLSCWIILLACTLAVQGSSSVSKSETIVDVGYIFPPGCAAIVKKYRGRVAFVCRRSTKQYHSTTNTEKLLLQSAILKILCHQMETSFGKNCTNVEDCDLGQVCVESTFNTCGGIRPG